MWHKFSEEDPPFEVPILVTDGKVMVVGTVTEEDYRNKERFWLDSGDSVTGYDWEWSFREHELTHWTEVPLFPD